MAGSTGSGQDFKDRDEAYRKETEGMTIEQKAGYDYMRNLLMQEGKQREAQGRSEAKQAGMEFAQAPDVSGFANMGGLLSMATPQQQRQEQGQPDINKYIHSLLGG